MEQNTNHKQPIVLIVVIILAIILIPLGIFLSRKTSSPGIQFVGKPTPNNAALVQRMAMSPLISTWTAEAFGTVASIQGSTITISQNNATLQFTTNDKTLFFNRANFKPGTQVTPISFSPSQIKVGNYISIAMVITKTSGNIPVASIVTLIPNVPPPPPPPPAKSATSPASKTP